MAEVSMTKKAMLDQQTIRKLTDLRLSLLRLHKVLLDDERAAYEKANGPIGSIGQVLSLVMSDPWFDWLHVFSRQIVKIDELEDNPDATEVQAMDLIHETAQLILPKQGSPSTGTEFMRRYKAALARNSAAVSAHADVLKAAYTESVEH